VSDEPTLEELLARESRRRTLRAQVTEPSPSPPPSPPPDEGESSAAAFVRRQAEQYEREVEEERLRRDVANENPRAVPEAVAADPLRDFAGAQRIRRRMRRRRGRIP
jgi:hypothetical protein